MDTRKITLVATILAIAMIAVGIGFAYTAFTQNGGNTTDVSYITVTQQDGEGQSKYSFTGNTAKIEFDTFNLESIQKIYYKLDDDKAVTMSLTDFPSYTFVDLGKVNLVASYVGDGDMPDTLNVTVRASTGFVSSDSWVYFLTNNYSITDHATDDIEIYAYANNATGTWVNGPDACQLVKSTTEVKKYDPKEIHLCFGYPTAIADVNFSDDIQDTDLRGYLRNFVAPVELDDGSVIFKATEESYTPTTPYVVTYNSNTTADDEFIALVAKSPYTLLGNNVTLFDAPNGKHFLGWNTDKNATTALPGAQTISANVTYYAIWAVNTNP